MNDFSVQVAFGLVGLFAIGLVCLRHLRSKRKEHQLARTTDHWLATQATIESGALLAEDQGHPSFRVSYHVRGEYHSGSFVPRPQPELSEDLIKELIGTKVQLRVDPANPTKFVVGDKQIRGFRVEPRLDVRFIAPWALGGLRTCLVLGFLSGWICYLSELANTNAPRHDLYIIEEPEWVFVLYTLFFLAPYIISLALAFSRRRFLVVSGAAIAVGLFGVPVFLIVAVLFVAPVLLSGFLALNAMGAHSNVLLIVDMISLLVFVVACIWIVVAGFWIARIRPGIFAAVLIGIITYLVVAGGEMESTRIKHQRQVQRPASEVLRQY